MSESSSTKPFTIGMVGGGTIGGGVYELIMNRLGGGGSHHNKNVPPSPNPSIIITKLCVRDLNKHRNFQIDETKTTLTTNVNDILHDDSIELVVEVMGGGDDGVDLAKTVVEKALKSGKHVVTANKALIAEYSDHLQSLLWSTHGGTANKNSVILAYEASVCGAIPIIHTLQTAYSGDIIQQIMGILCTGTTNFMLGKMEEGANYDDVLKEAHELGYFADDPSAHVEGWDVRAKIAILAKLAFGKTISDVENIPCKGITEVTTVDFEYAKLLGCTIKLIGTAKRLSKYGEYDGDLSVYVAPHMVPISHLLSKAERTDNIVTVTSANMGMACYTGPGSGRFAAANSIVADIVRIARKQAVSPPFPIATANNGELLEFDFNYTSRFYVRIPYQDQIGIIARVGAIAEELGISLYSVLQNPITDRMVADFCLTTEECPFSHMEAFCEAIASEDYCRMKPVYMPLLSSPSS